MADDRTMHRLSLADPQQRTALCGAQYSGILLTRLTDLVTCKACLKRMGNREPPA